ncbi:SDR family oxidoreductase [Sphingomonas endolithica]|uniref:SDR family oxidoreductase n=1 Tax=Sphingomonas endolithica TaxID=2972485 RepID=UPI0021AF79AD|nr:SDR family oxidoreductase [Sphingomonas sp. ZFBP2030]
MTAIKLKPLADQVMLITGASSGIGLVTARAAARRGARVMLVARNKQALSEAAAALRAEGHQADYAVADVASIADVREAATAAVARFGRIDTWVNCAGVTIYAKLVDTPEDEHQALFQTNYFGVVHGSLIAIQHLQEHGGALITVGSIASDIPSPIMGAYAASKHATKGFTESLRIEINADMLPISVTLIKPAGIDTPIAQHAANHQEGEALIPPSVYAPELVADAILSAAVKPQRAITVGGVGRLQVLFGEHFPGLLAKFGGLAMPMLQDRNLPKTPGSNLHAPMPDGAERSENQLGRPVSIYAVARKPAVTLGLLGLAVAGIGAAALTRRAQTSPKGKRHDR